MKRRVLLLTLSSVLLSTACASTEADNTGSSQAAGENWLSLERSGGEGVYTEKCGMCHRADGMGTFILGRRLDPEVVWLENRSDLQPEFIKMAVRRGFGLMFPMSRGEVSDAQLDTIATYLAGEE